MLRYTTRLRGAGSGIFWLNGCCIGRYRAERPQRTLHAPEPLWRRGENVIVVLDFARVGDRVELRDGLEL